MNKEIKQKWIEALRSGEYTQNRRMLRDGEGHFCCLGVLCDVQGVQWTEVRRHGETFWPKGYRGSMDLMPKTLKSGLRECEIDILVDMNNDNNFSEIAGYIEEEL